MTRHKTPIRGEGYTIWLDRGKIDICQTPIGPGGYWTWWVTAHVQPETYPSGRMDANPGSPVKDFHKAREQALQQYKEMTNVSQ